MQRKPREEPKEVTPEEAGLKGFGGGGPPKFTKQAKKEDPEEVKGAEPVR